MGVESDDNEIQYLRVFAHLGGAMMAPQGPTGESKHLALELPAKLHVPI